MRSYITAARCAGGIRIIARPCPVVPVHSVSLAEIGAFVSVGSTIGVGGTLGRYTGGCMLLPQAKVANAAVAGGVSDGANALMG